MIYSETLCTVGKRAFRRWVITLAGAASSLY